MFATWEPCPNHPAALPAAAPRMSSRCVVALESSDTSQVHETRQGAFELSVASPWRLCRFELQDEIVQLAHKQRIAHLLESSRLSFTFEAWPIHPRQTEIVCEESYEQHESLTPTPLSPSS